MNHIILMMLLVSSLLAGCTTGKIVVKQIVVKQSENDKKPKSKEMFEGIPFRMAESWKEYFMYTTFVKNGQISGDCQPQFRVRVLNNVPSSELYTIAYETEKATQWFTKQKFAVALHANGTLASVSVESTPPSPKELAEVAQIVAGLPMFVPPSAEETSDPEEQKILDKIALRPPCTGTPQYIKHCPIRDEVCEEEAKKEMRSRNKEAAIKAAILQGMEAEGHAVESGSDND